MSLYYSYLLQLLLNSYNSFKRLRGRALVNTRYLKQNCKLALHTVCYVIISPLKLTKKWPANSGMFLGCYDAKNLWAAYSILSIPPWWLCQLMLTIQMCSLLQTNRFLWKGERHTNISWLKTVFTWIYVPTHPNVAAAHCLLHFKVK